MLSIELFLKSFSQTLASVCVLFALDLSKL